MAEELILIVDDNGQNRKLARDVLRFAGFRTLEAEGGGEGVSLAAEHVPDLVLMDIRMPDMNGTEALRRLRNDERTARIPIVALSASVRATRIVGTPQTSAASRAPFRVRTNWLVGTSTFPPRWPHFFSAAS